MLLHFKNPDTVNQEPTIGSNQTWGENIKNKLFFVKDWISDNKRNMQTLEIQELKSK